VFSTSTDLQESESNKSCSWPVIAPVVHPVSIRPSVAACNEYNCKSNVAVVRQCTTRLGSFNLMCMSPRTCPDAVQGQRGHVDHCGPQRQSLCTYRWRLNMLAAEAAAQTSRCAVNNSVVCRCDAGRCRKRLGQNMKCALKCACLKPPRPGARGWAG